MFGEEAVEIEVTEIVNAVTGEFPQLEFFPGLVLWVLGNLVSSAFSNFGPMGGDALVAFMTNEKNVRTIAGISWCHLSGYSMCDDPELESE